MPQSLNCWHQLPICHVNSPKSQTPQEIRAKNFQWLILHWHHALTLLFIIMGNVVVRVMVIFVVKVRESL